MESNNYIITVKHDRGVTHIHTVWSDEAGVKEFIMREERCPESAIIAVRFAGRVGEKPRWASLADLQPDECAALLDFARANGRCWKSKLNKGWLVAKYPGPLQAIRNRLGPTWLRELRLPRE